MKEIIKDSLAKGMSYHDYRKMVSDLLAEGKSTGKQQTEALFNYSLLNDKRMKRLDKTITLTEETLEVTQGLSSPRTWLVITEGWCGDAAQLLPIIHKVADASTQIDLKIVLRDENEELMHQFLTNGSKSIPKLIALNEHNEVIDSWGPRPKVATQMVQEYKEKYGKIDDALKKDLQLWYNKDKGLNAQQDLLKLL